MKSVHFICRGNVYRSRLAEAYAMSLLEKKGLARVTSSGIEAERNLGGNVDPETVRLLELENIQNYLTSGWHQTTQTNIDSNELIVFMSQTLYSQANELFSIPAQRVRIWDIRDIDGIYPDIKKKVTELIETEL